MNRSVLFALPLVLAACTATEVRPVDHFDADAPLFSELDSADLPSSMLAPPVQTLSLSVSAMVPGEAVNFTITGLNANETVYIGRGMGGLGNGPCIGAAGGSCLDIANPVFVLTTTTADADGIAQLTVNLPASVPLGLSVGFQALAIRGAGGDDSTKSNPVLRTTAQGSGDLTTAMAGDIIVSEIMQNPNAVNDNLGEWFEVHNNTEFDIDLSGLEVSDDNGSGFVVSGPLILPAGGDVVFGRNLNAAVNGGVPVDYAWSGFALGNTNDSIIISYGGVEFDRVAWDDGATFPDPVGTSMNLDAESFDIVGNDAGSAWCEATTVFGDGDFGTPGGPNEICVGAVAPTCDDGMQNGTETGVDCGGSCPAICQNPSYLNNEDFENGDFASFPYTFEGPNVWSIETNPLACHDGAYCMRTSPTHGLDEMSATTLALSVREDTTVSFWAKVNTEPGEHFFRFYVDGVLELELSGQIDWTEYEFPVLATGPNGADRVLRWEYTRTDFVDPSHVPWNQVWVDDIDLPDWNTPPTVPQQMTPTNGTITTVSPSFSWGAVDTDFDTITYEMQYADNVEFTNAITTGETFATSVAPAMSEGLFYWRVRSKDDSDYRWSEWSDVRAVTFDAAYPYDLAWRQTEDDEFLMNDQTGVVSGGSIVLGDFDSGNTSTVSHNSGIVATHTISGTPSVPPNTTGTLTVNIYGDYDDIGEDVDVISMDGTTVRTNWWIDRLNTWRSISLSISDVGRFVNDGSVTVRVDPNSSVGNSQSYVRLTYQIEEATETYPIEFATFGPSATLWDKVQWTGSGVVLHVLDADGNLLDEATLPGNAAGFTTRTVSLADVDPVDHPALKLQVTGTVEELRVTGGDRLVWEFDHDGDVEGWQADDIGSAPTIDALAGVLRFDGVAGGLDPNVQFHFNQPVDSTRFTTANIRVRSSNNYFDDSPTFYWASNFGTFDDRRSFQQTRFLFAYQSLSYDLTVMPTSPQEPWQGAIDAIRFDPVDVFVDQIGDPADGWFEIDRIELQ